MTLREWLTKGESLLKAGPHPERARQDAELLLRHATRLDRAALIMRGDDTLDEARSVAFVELLARRGAGEPIQYICGETEFYGLPFRVTRDVLIPRPETEHLVEKVVALSARFEKPWIVDVGAGSGAIAVALAHQLPGAKISGIDLSATALAVAKRNSVLNGVENRIEFRQGDLLEGVVPGSLNIVVSNPPYVPEGDRDSMSVEVREFEPGLALFAGADGLDVYRRLIPAAYDALVPGGWVAMEIGYGQAASIRELLAASGFQEIEFTRDLQGIERVACGRRA